MEQNELEKLIKIMQGMQVQHYLRMEDQNPKHYKYDHKYVVSEAEQRGIQMRLLKEAHVLFLLLLERFHINFYDHLCSCDEEQIDELFMLYIKHASLDEFLKVLNRYNTGVYEDDDDD
ncbi:MAG: hypothetical protein LUG46_02285 [Erysipelotrichaceae bacterium]|nr:hypothetical protein [Erysipelotrichaceae bacterium]